MEKRLYITDPLKGVLKQKSYENMSIKIVFCEVFKSCLVYFHLQQHNDSFKQLSFKPT